MSFKILLLPPDVDASWPEKIRQTVPGAVAKAFGDPHDALADIADADAAYGTVPPALFARAQQLCWICAARAGLGGDWFYDALVQSDVPRGALGEPGVLHLHPLPMACYTRQRQWLNACLNYTSSRVTLCVSTRSL
jgi:hypothetical protein